MVIRIRLTVKPIRNLVHDLVDLTVRQMDWLICSKKKGLVDSSIIHYFILTIHLPSSAPFSPHLHLFPLFTWHPLLLQFLWQILLWPRLPKIPLTPHFEAASNSPITHSPSLSRFFPLDRRTDWFSKNHMILWKSHDFMLSNRIRFALRSLKKKRSVTIAGSQSDWVRSPIRFNFDTDYVGYR